MAEPDMKRLLTEHDVEIDVMKEFLEKKLSDWCTAP
jgi:hypothetical protein